MIITYKYKLYQTRKTKHLDNLMFVSSQVYNHCIALHKRYYRLYKKSLDKGKLQKHITWLKQSSKPQWKQLGSQVIQEITDRIEDGYKKFFRRENKRPPKFRGYRNYKSFTFKGKVGYKISDNTITINSIKRSYKFWKSREIDGQIKTLTIKRDALGDYYLTIAIEKSFEKSNHKTGKTAGFDFGLKTFLTSSEIGFVVNSPEFYKKSANAIKKASRNLSSKKKGSHNRKKARQNLARVHRRIEHQREAFQWSTAHRLIDNFDIMCFEDLNLDGMKRLWGRKISDLALDSFMRKVSYLAAKYGKQVVEIPRFYPSSKTCSCCGHVKQELSLKDRIFVCEICNLVIDRDYNASLNIKKVGTSTFAGEGGKTSYGKQPLMIAESLVL